MTRLLTILALVFALAFGMVQGAFAQQASVWVQVEAQPTLGEAQTRVRAYAARFPNVAGFYLGSGWYGIALGPYSAADAQTLLGQLLTDRSVPADSYLSDGSTFQQQFWPIGVGAQTAPQSLPNTPATEPPLAEAPIVEVPATAPEPVIAAPAVTDLPDETVREAQASEELLSRPEKEQLQVALQWAGFYDGAIDGA